eukprot:6202300-Pleurochrysis_carterae.AAC.1
MSGVDGCVQRPNACQQYACRCRNTRNHVELTMVNAVEFLKFILNAPRCANPIMPVVARKKIRMCWLADGDACHGGGAHAGRRPVEDVAQ